MKKYSSFGRLFKSPSRMAHTSSNKLFLLALDWTRPKDPPSSLGHASILTHLRKNDIYPVEKSWSVNHQGFKASRVTDFILKHAQSGNDVALGAFVWNEPYIQEIIKTLKNERYPGRIILGGPQISYVKSGIEKYYPNADVFIRGYAENAILQFMKSDQEKPMIKGIHYANDPDLGLSANAEIEQLPSPYLEGVIKPQPFIRWESQRGCPFRCSFCQHRESDISMKRRQLSKSRIMQEIDWICDNRIINDIAVLDPTFNSGPHYISILERFLENGYSGKLALQCRMEMVTDEFLNIVESLNQIGRVILEFGLQTIHRNEQKIIQRPNNMKRVEKVLFETKKRHIPTEVSLIFGLPEQTVSSFKESVDFCKAHDVPVIDAFPLMLLRGTPLHDQKTQLGLIESSDINLKVPRVQSEIPHVVASPTFTQSEWKEMALIAESLEEYNQSCMNAQQSICEDML